MTTATNLTLLQSSPCLTPRGSRLLNKAVSELDDDKWDTAQSATSPELKALEAWWQSTHSTAKSFAFLQGRMTMISNFLRGKLLEDYIDQPYTATKFVMDISGMVANGSLEADEQSTDWKLANAIIRQPVCELDLDLDYVKERLLRLSERQFRPMNDVHACGENRQKLHELLEGDRQALARLVVQEKVNQNDAIQLGRAIARHDAGTTKTTTQSWLSWLT